MTDNISLSFDEFLRQCNDAKSTEDGDQALFRAAAAEEWQRLKDRLRQLTEGKRLGADIFEWCPYPAPYPDFIKLKDVALCFESGTVVSDGAQKYRLVFSRRPLRSGEMWANEAPIPVERWWLSLDAQGERFHWQVKESQVRMVTEDFAEHAAMRFVEYQQRYVSAVKARYPWNAL
jgi:hypothetical protein